MKIVIILLIGLIQTPVEEFTKSSDEFLTTYVRDGRVNYQAIHNNPAQIKRLYDYIGEADMSSLTDVQKKAFYINAYNLIVIYQVSTYYPLKSPMDASGFFDGVKHKVAGEMMTLNALEIKKLLIPYKDARIHFALACAAKSCPELASFAYDPSTLDNQLTVRTRKSINDPLWLRVDQEKKELAISKIFQWYQKDFEAEGGSVMAFINKYRRTKIPAGFHTTYYEYDWQLNE